MPPRKSKSRKVVDEEEEETKKNDTEEDEEAEEPETKSKSKRKKDDTGFIFKQKKYAGNKKWKPLKQVLQGEDFESLHPSVPTFVNIEAPPSLYPAKKYCDFTGFEAKYTDPSSGLRYHSSNVYKFVLLPLLQNASVTSESAAEASNLRDQKIKEYLSLRRGNVSLR